ncbi:uncharacterized protein LOC126680627 [Mercurialis annua]|uniref:uncharacterized protein LOC126680627 n=1 Tax=Mercurialis annua TaxID=3986 RepID=UPI00216093D7|nr:uncharacterized protein LOC126680627 [Mercurialis annua]
MASVLFQTRSDSLPTKSHPLVSELDDQICRLRACEATSTSSMSITHKLSGLQDLYDCVDKILLLPLTQQALAQHQNRKWVDELLDGSLRILDVCNSAKDALLQTKEYTLELESTIRRRQGGSENNIATEVKKYITSRKMAKKSIQKAMSNLKGLESKCCVETGTEIANFVSMLREVQVVTLAVLKSFMSFISGTKTVTKTKTKTNNWLLVSKIMLNKRIASEEEEEVVNEFALADIALESLKCDNNMENVQNQLKNLEQCIEDFEEGSHNLFRRMIKTRVTLLNILS